MSMQKKGSPLVKEAILYETKMINRTFKTIRI